MVTVKVPVYGDQVSAVASMMYCLVTSNSTGAVMVTKLVSTQGFLSVKIKVLVDVLIGLGLNGLSIS